MAARFQSLRGFNDLLPGATEHWQRVETDARELFRRYGFREIRPPHMEPTELFVRSVGQETDIVGKEMFTLESGEDSMTLRPEVTAGVCRAFVEHGLDRLGLSRFYYIGPCFRKERPQKGRLRQFHQAGVEVLGEAAPETDVEVIAVGADFVRAVGVTETRLHLNSIGDGACRPHYREVLVAALRERADRLCEECRRRIDRNPLRVLDCKVPSCQAALADVPRIGDYLCDDCRTHFERVKAGLEEIGIEYTLDANLVRGLDYYSRTTFEIRSAGLGSQNTVLGGGRYDGLVEQLGGGRIPGIGWAAGIDRLLIAAGLDTKQAPADLDLFVVTLGDAARARALVMVQALRREGLGVSWDPAGHGLGGQMKRAGRSGARYAALVGDDELARGAVTLKNLASGEQSEAPLAAAELAARLRQA